MSKQTHDVDSPEVRDEMTSVPELPARNLSRLIAEAIANCPQHGRLSEDAQIEHARAVTDQVHRTQNRTPTPLPAHVWH